jgi:site-specific DNA recombinase
MAWERRPRAAALLAVARDARRSFDAVVVGEFERAFSARQFLPVAEMLASHGIQVWLPEVDGPVDRADPVHRALVTALGAKARHEVVRARHRTLAAMRAQTVEQAGSSAGVRRTGIGSWTRARTRTGRRLRGVRDPAVSETMIRWAAINTITRRIARGRPATRQQRRIFTPQVALLKHAPR